MTQVDNNTVVQSPETDFTQVSSSSLPDPTLRLYAIVRGDLGMSPGKIASQSGHAYLGAFLRCNDDSVKAEYHADFPESPGTKVCLVAKNLDQILRAEAECIEAGIPCFKVVDSGCENFFGGNPTVTALGIGPATKAQVKHITKRFQLL